MNIPIEQLQKNLSWQAGRTDEDIMANPDPMDEMMFGEATDPEAYRARARAQQDELDQGKGVRP